MRLALDDTKRFRLRKLDRSCPTLRLGFAFPLERKR